MRKNERVDEWDTRKNESETVLYGKIEIEKGEKEKKEKKLTQRNWWRKQRIYR